MPLRAPLAALLALVATGCSGGAAAIEPLPPAPEPTTRATLAGPLCDGAVCTCSSEEGDAGRPDAGKKRFEVRLGPAEHELWATIDGMVLYKSKERATDCFYVDLAPGDHAVALRGASASGVGFEARIAEQGGAASDAWWWYGTFGFACGAPGVCDRRTLDEFIGGLRGKHGKLDPCGSTKVQGVSWRSGRMPDSGRPTDLEVDLRLEVYAFAPQNPPGHADCAGSE
jgi:hypothetical protein